MRVDIEPICFGQQTIWSPIGKGHDPSGREIGEIEPNLVTGDLPGDGHKAGGERLSVTQTNRAKVEQDAGERLYRRVAGQRDRIQTGTA